MNKKRVEKHILSIECSANYHNIFIVYTHNDALFVNESSFKLRGQKYLPTYPLMWLGLLPFKLNGNEGYNHIE